ncbi:MAG: hypothetical protein U5K69_18980 [Balneolaceae bacterium]|nr:hypothetical protein [Balneolaceae bacterium]
MNFAKLKNKLKSNIKNIPGWSTDRKIVVFESDDWGSNTIASKEHYQKLLEMGVPVDRSSFNRYDTIERSSDLEALFEILSSVKDASGNPAVFTPFVNLANPDFERIKESGYQEYYYESFDKTLEKYGEREDVLELYRQGIDAGLFKPQFHGREHLAVPLWLKYLQQGNDEIRKAFEQKYYSYPAEGLPSLAGSFRPAFYFESDSDLPFLRKSIREGTDLFEELFGYRATVFDPPNGVFSSSLERYLWEADIHTIVANRFRPEPVGNGEVKKKFYSFGKTNNLGQTYYIRTCQFELYNNTSVDDCLSMIRAAFRWGKPAIICTHRVNYNGGIDVTNRDHGLKELGKLLGEIVKKWPDVEFMSSGDFAEVLRED